MDRFAHAVRWLFDSEHGATDRLIPRWLFLRALGCIYFSAFFSLVFQIRGLIGPEGILPANEYLQAVAHSLGYSRGLWFAPTLLWISSGPHMLTALCWVGMVASLLLVVNFWPRGMLAICFVCFLSFVSAAQDFSGYQSDGMLLEAGFISLFFAPSGFRPGFGRGVAAIARQSVPAAVGMVSHLLRIRSGENCGRRSRVAALHRHGRVLPERPAAHVDRLVRAASCRTGFMLRRPSPLLRLSWDWFGCYFCRAAGASLCFLIVTPWELGVILTANYTFLNYLVLALGVLLLDDRFLLRFFPAAMEEILVVAPTIDSSTRTQAPRDRKDPEKCSQSNRWSSNDFHAESCAHTLLSSGFFMPRRQS